MPCTSMPCTSICMFESRTHILLDTHTHTHGCKGARTGVRMHTRESQICMSTMISIWLHALSHRRAHKHAHEHADQHMAACTLSQACSQTCTSTLISIWLHALSQGTTRARSNRQKTCAKWKRSIRQVQGSGIPTRDTIQSLFLF